jgi:hypothetical protein
MDRLAWLHRAEPFTNEELARMWRVDLSQDHEEVEETISQFEACAMEIIREWYEQTVNE